MPALRALLVGLTRVDPAAHNGWDGRDGCAGCELDVQNVENLLKPLGFAVSKLVTEGATRDGILSSLRSAATELAAGDEFVFYFSGHGGQQRDTDDEDDGRDETLVAFDGHLIDDQLGDIWLQFRPGVHLVMISDSCNSGTNYRMGRTIVRPTPWRPVRAAAARSMNAAMIHMGGCRDGGTSAGYQAGGAFTTALCNVWNNGAFSGTYKDFYTAICEAMAEEQEPQYSEYGPVTEDFRSSRPFAHNRSGPILPLLPSGGSVGCMSADLQGRLLDAFQQMLTVIAGQEGKPVAGARASVPRAAGERHLVYVHGISSHAAGYSNDWWAALQPYTTVFQQGVLKESRHEILWSDLVNKPQARAADATQLREQIRAVLEDRQRQQIDSPEAATRFRQARGDGMAIDDFVLYMTDEGLRSEIIQRFTSEVRALLAQGAQVDVISHSWGTVVAYEGLRELDAEVALTGRVANFFTVGSALSIPPVRWRLRSANQDGQRPRLVEHWHNLDAAGDIIGGSLSEYFAVDLDTVDLEPVGCTRNLGGLGWYEARCAHSSYFRRENELVNRDIFAQAINGARHVGHERRWRPPWTWSRCAKCKLEVNAFISGTVMVACAAAGTTGPGGLAVAQALIVGQYGMVAWEAVKAVIFSASVDEISRKICKSQGKC